MYSEDPAYRAGSLKLDGPTQQAMTKKPLNFRQAGETYRGHSQARKAELIANFAGDLKAVKNPAVREQHVAHAYAADPEYGERLALASGVDLAKAKAIAAKLADDPMKK